MKKTTTLRKIERILQISNLVFFTISKLSIKQLEIIKHTHIQSGKKDYGELVSHVSSSLGIKEINTKKIIRELTYSRLMFIEDGNYTLNLTPLGEMVALELLRDVN